MTLHLASDTLAPFIARQKSIADTCARAWRANVLHLNGEYAPVDALFVRNGRVVAVAEIKTRNKTIDGVRQFNNPAGYLVTFDKLLVGRDIARKFGAPFLLIVGLADALVYWLVADAAGEFQTQLGTARTTTPWRGGTAERCNAFLSLDDMRTLTAMDGNQ
jgi:hypothetical protein